MIQVQIKSEEGGGGGVLSQVQENNILNYTNHMKYRVSNASEFYLRAIASPVNSAQLRAIPIGNPNEI